MILGEGSVQAFGKKSEKNGTPFFKMQFSLVRMGGG